MRRNIWRNNLGEGKLLRITSGRLPSCSLEEPRVGVPISDGLLVVVHVTGRPRIGDCWKQLLGDQRFILIDRERYLPPCLETIVPGNMLEGAILPGISRHKWPKDSPKLSGNLARLNRALVEHRKMATFTKGLLHRQLAPRT